MTASVPLEMDDIFGEAEEEEFNISRLPDLEDELEPMRVLGQEEAEEDGDEGVNEITDDPELLAKLKSMKGASKQGPKRSIPKLDADRLTGERGIPILPRVFEKVRLKGKGHEAEDLKTIMRHMEHWGHRLFPKMPFGEVLERCERLGSKKSVQTCVKRIRLDMPVLPEDHIGDDVQRVGDANDRQVSDDEEEREDNERHAASPFPEIDEDEIEDLIRDQEEAMRDTSGQIGSDSNERNSTTTSPKVPGPEPSKSSGMSEEVKARIEQNKKLALERRAAKLTGKQNGSSEPRSIGSSSVTTETVSRDESIHKANHSTGQEETSTGSNLDVSNGKEDGETGVESVTNSLCHKHGKEATEVEGTCQEDLTDGDMIDEIELTNVEKEHQEEATENVDQEEETEKVDQENATEKVDQEEATENVDQEEATEKVDKEKATEIVDQEEATEIVDQEEATEKVDQEGATEKVDQEEATENVDQEEATENVDQEEATEKVDQEEATENVDQEEVTENVDQEEATENVDQEEATENVDQEEATENVDQEEATENVDQEEETKKMDQEKSTDVVKESAEEMEGVEETEQSNEGDLVDSH